MSQGASIEWKDGVPVALDFDDPYFSLHDGLAETEYVFLRGNDLPARFVPEFHIAELGFGTGLNMLATWRAWEVAGTGGTLNYTAFEAFPMKASDIAQALRNWPELAHYAAPFLIAWERGERTFALGKMLVDIQIGDAQDCLPKWDNMADAWYLDGFSPAKNPSLWTPEILADVGKHTAPNGSFATYTAAGHVRQSLIDAGFNVERIKGFANKRHMTVGRLR